MKLEQRVRDFIRDKHLMADDANVLVALSGGADSVALLHMLVRIGYHCHAVHCNFHLRGDESNRDEQFAVKLCHSLRVPVEVVYFNTLEHAAEHHISVEMAARELRYREFERIRQANKLDVIAVAHHQDDAVETMLLNLIRGAGINGLTGMRAINGHVIRPLLCVSRNEVLEYLTQIEQPYLTDSTNLTDMYARNKVRLKVLPLMQEINPAAKENILNAASHLSEAATIYNRVINEERQRVVDSSFTEKSNPWCNTSAVITLSISALLASEAPKTVLFEVLHPYGFNATQIASIFRSLQSESGRIFQTDKYTLLRDRTHLILIHKEEAQHVPDALYPLPDTGTMTLPDGTVLTITRLQAAEGWQVPRTNDWVCIDATRLTHPLIVRHPREGDRFRPFGLKGTKLLSDFYTDLKLPHTDKCKQWLVCHGDQIIWAMGQRTSEWCRLQGDEKEIVCIKLTRPTPPQTK